METGRRVGAFGLAGPSARIASFLVADSPLARVLQLPDSVEGREADFLKAHSRPLQLTYGYLSAAPAKPDARVETVLADALRRNRTGSVIVSSRRQSSQYQGNDQPNNGLFYYGSSQGSGPSVAYSSPSSGRRSHQCFGQEPDALHCSVCENLRLQLARLYQALLLRHGLAP